MSTRLAVTISSNYSENNVLLPREVFEDTSSMLASQLASLDTGFEVVTLKATRDLPEQLDALRCGDYVVRVHASNDGVSCAAQRG